MFRLIEGLPDDVLGLEAAGRVTHEDYRDVLIPKAEALMEQGPIKMIYVIGANFSAYDMEALWDDGRFGAKHWHDFKKVAVVTDVGWIRAAVNLFRPVFPCEAKLFALAELEAAKHWIAAS
jgi:SpoIIAA-like